MSKRDIKQVCCLAAHLAQRSCGDPPYRSTPPAALAASDAMRLQRLGRSARNAYKNKQDEALRNALMRLHDQADEVLEPYGLDTVHSPYGLLIIGLPSNTKDCGEGYAI